MREESVRSGHVLHAARGRGRACALQGCSRRQRCRCALSGSPGKKSTDAALHGSHAAPVDRDGDGVDSGLPEKSAPLAQLVIARRGLRGEGDNRLQFRHGRRQLFRRPPFH